MGIFGGGTEIKDVAAQNSAHNFTYTGQERSEIPRDVTVVTIARSVKDNQIDKQAFSYCFSLKCVKLHQPISTNKLKVIGFEAFRNCTKLEEVELLCNTNNKGGLEHIHAFAFHVCSSLTSITFPASVKSIGRWAFCNCYQLETVLFCSNNTSNSGNGISIVRQNSNGGIELIPECAFSGCASLKTIQIPATVNVIDKWAFRDCTLLQEVELNEGGTLTEIGWGAFSNCKSLRCIQVPSSVKVIRSGAFRGCVNLTTAELPEGLEEMEAAAFHDCKSLQQITIPSTLKVVEESVFCGCDQLTDVTLLEGLEQIKKHSFLDCTSLKLIKLPATVRVVDRSAFDNCPQLSSVELGDGIETLDYQLCSSFKRIKIPSSVKIISDASFSCCSQLEAAELSEGLERIECNAFHKCKSLIGIQIPSSVTVIQKGAFQSCQQLVSVELGGSGDIKSMIVELGGDKGKKKKRTKKTECTMIIDKSAFCDCSSLRNLAIPHATIATRKGDSSNDTAQYYSFEGCHDLMRLFGTQEHINAALRGRFDELPIHRLCYYQSYYSMEDILEQLQTAIGTIGLTTMQHQNNDGPLLNNNNNRISSEEVYIPQDCLGMTPLHILACSTTQRLDLYRILMDSHPESLVTADRWGCYPILYAIWGNAPPDIVYLLMNRQKSAYPNVHLNWNDMIENLCRSGASLERVQVLLRIQQVSFPEHPLNWQKAAKELAIQCLNRGKSFTSLFSKWGVVITKDFGWMINSFRTASSQPPHDHYQELILALQEIEKMLLLNEKNDNWQIVYESFVPPLKGWWSPNSNDISLETFRFLVKCRIPERLTDIGVGNRHRKWQQQQQQQQQQRTKTDNSNTDTDKIIKNLFRKIHPTMSLMSYCDSIHSKLVAHEMIHEKWKDAACLLELALWKTKIDESKQFMAGPSHCLLDGYSADIKGHCRTECGAEVIIPNVLRFLDLGDLNKLGGRFGDVDSEETSLANHFTAQGSGSQAGLAHRTYQDAGSCKSSSSDGCFSTYFGFATCYNDSGINDRGEQYAGTQEVLLDGKTTRCSHERGCAGCINSVFGAKSSRRRKISILVSIIVILLLFVMGVAISIFVDAFGPKTDDARSSKSGVGVPATPPASLSTAPSPVVNATSEKPSASPVVNATSEKPSASPVTATGSPASTDIQSSDDNGNGMNHQVGWDDESGKLVFTFKFPTKSPTASPVPSNSPSPTAMPTIGSTASMRPTSEDMMNNNMTTWPPTQSAIPSSPTSGFNNTAGIASPTFSPIVSASLSEESPTIAPTTSGMPSAALTSAPFAPARLSGECKAFLTPMAATPDSISITLAPVPDVSAAPNMTTKEVIIPYQYELITDGSEDNINTIVAQLEDGLHSSLIAGEKCSGTANTGGIITADTDTGGIVNAGTADTSGIVRSRNRIHSHPGLRVSGEDRSLQAGVEEVQAEYYYQGFNSNPPDQVSNEPCPESVLATLEEGQRCYLIMGGITALVDESMIDNDGADEIAMEETIKSETASLAEDVFSDPVSYEALGGVEKVISFKEVPSTAVAVASRPTESPTATTSPSSDGGIAFLVMSPTMMPSKSASPSTSAAPTFNGTIGDETTNANATNNDTEDIISAALMPTSSPVLSLATSFTSEPSSTGTSSSAPSSLSMSILTSIPSVSSVDQIETGEGDGGADATPPSMMPSASASLTEIISPTTGDESADATSLPPTTSLAPTINMGAGATSLSPIINKGAGATSLSPTTSLLPTTNKSLPPTINNGAGATSLSPTINKGAGSLSPTTSLPPTIDNGAGATSLSPTINKVIGAPTSLSPTNNKDTSIDNEDDTSSSQTLSPVSASTGMPSLAPILAVTQTITSGPALSSTLTVTSRPIMTSTSAPTSSLRPSLTSLNDSLNAFNDAEILTDPSLNTTDSSSNMIENDTNTTPLSTSNFLETLSYPYTLALSMEGQSMLSQHGFSVAISGDGSLVAVGAKDAFQYGTNQKSGAVYLYSMDMTDGSTGSLTLLQTIYGQSPGDEFGNAIALSNDGNTLVVGSRSENEQAGALRIYQRDESKLTSLRTTHTPTWALMEGGTMVGETPSGKSGWSVSISGDGNVVAMGSPKDGSDEGGSVHAYKYDDSFSTWYPYGSVIQGSTPGDATGFSVSLSYTGLTMVIGIPKAANLDGDSNAGKTAVYTMSGTQWLLLGQEIHGETATEVDGTSVAMSQDGRIVVIGGKGRNEFNEASDEVILTSIGYCRIYKLEGSVWELQRSIMGQADKERLGSMVAVSPDGKIVACGGVTGVNDGITTGVVRLWNRETLEESTIWPRGGDLAEASTFGSSLALSNDGEYVVIGAPAWSNADGGGENVGAIQIFRDVM